MLEWAVAHDDLRRAWRECPRGDWLLWLALKLGVENRVIVFAACECVRLALPFTTDEEPRTAIILAEQYASGDGAVTLEEVIFAAQDSKKAGLRAGCHAGFDAANAAFAAVHAAMAAAPGSLADGAAVAAVVAVAEAAADHATHRIDAESAKIEMYAACANVVRNRIAEATIQVRWRQFFDNVETAQA